MRGCKDEVGKYEQNAHLLYACAQAERADLVSSINDRVSGLGAVC